MAGDELVRRIAVTMLAPALGQHEFILRFQHREPADFLQIAGKAGFGCENRQSCSTGHKSALQNLPPMHPAGEAHRRSPSRQVLVMLRPRSLIAGATV